MKTHLQKNNFTAVCLIVISLFLIPKAKSQCTFGNFPPTYTTSSSFGANYLLGVKFTLASTGTLTGLGYRGNGTGIPMRMAIYTDVSGVTGTLVAMTNTAINSLGNTILPVTATTVIPAGKYWVMGIYATGPFNQVNYTNSATSNTVSYISLPFASLPPTSASWITYTGQDLDYWAVTAGTSPSVSISGNSSVCSGNPVSLTANGATAYNWSTGATTQSISVTPSVTTTYSVMGYNGACFNSALKTITVNASPSLSVSSTNSIICVGQSATLTVGGASTYTWSTASNSTSIVVTPTISSTYTVVGTGTNTCTKTSTITQIVSACTGLNELQIGVSLNAFPNPTTGNFILELPNEVSVVIYNTLGEIIIDKRMQSGKHEMDLTGQSSGMYLIKVISDSHTDIIKLNKN